jgi:hypothetical protein
MLYALGNFWARFEALWERSENDPNTEQAVFGELTRANCPEGSWKKVQEILDIGSKKHKLRGRRTILTFNRYCPGCGGVLPSLMAKLHSIILHSESLPDSQRNNALLLAEASLLWNDTQLRQDLGCKCLDDEQGMKPIPRESENVRERWRTIIFDPESPECPFVRLLQNGHCTTFAYAAVDAEDRGTDGFTCVGHVGLSLLNGDNLFTTIGCDHNDFGCVDAVFHNDGTGWRDRLHLVPARDPAKKGGVCAGHPCCAPLPAGPCTNRAAGPCTNRLSLGMLANGACSAWCLLLKLIEGQQTPAAPPASAA